MNAPVLHQVCPVIIVRNATRTLEQTLSSLSDFREVVVLDNGSSDNSRDIACAYNNVKLIESPFAGFGPTRNTASQHASTAFILALDADESLSPQLLQSIRELDLSQHRPGTLYGFYRVNTFAGKRLRSGLGREFITRLYHRDEAEFEGMVHERLVATGSSALRNQRLSGVAHHDPYESVGHLFYKRWLYARPVWRGQRIARHPAIASGRALWRFLRCYLFQLGFIDGWRGFVLAVAEGHGTFLKYVWGYDAKQRRLRGDSAVAGDLDDDPEPPKTPS